MHEADATHGLNLPNAAIEEDWEQRKRTFAVTAPDRLPIVWLPKARDQRSRQLEFFLSTTPKWV
jgi:hypothetical protein